jgi:hypothetical protein
LEIIQTNNEKSGNFKIYDGESMAGELVYKWSGKNRFIIEHTEVAEKMEGKGIGKRLVLEAVTYARNNALKILPLCTYAKSVFDKTPEIHDVLF